MTRTLAELAEKSSLSTMAVQRHHLPLIEAELAGLEPTHLVLVCDRLPVPSGRLFADRWPDASVTVLTTVAPLRRPARLDLADVDDDDDVVRELALRPPAEVIIDLRRLAGTRKSATFSRAFLSLTGGGRYLVAGTPSEQGGKRGAANVAEFVLSLAARKARSPRGRWPGMSAVERGLGKALAAVRVEQDFLAATKGGDHVLKVDPATAARAVPARGGAREVLARRAAVTVRSASTIRSNDAELERQRLPGTDVAEELVCTAYGDALCAPLPSW